MSHLEKVKSYYERTALGAYDRWDPLGGAVHYGFFEDPGEIETLSGCQPEEVARVHFQSLQTMLHQLLERLEVVPGEVILDAGCGKGGLTFPLAALGARPIGLNISPLQLKEAKRLALSRRLKQEALFLVANYSRVPLPDNFCDRALFFESLVHAPQKEVVLQEAARVLRPGGKILMAEYALRSASDTLDYQGRRLVAELNRGWVMGIIPRKELLAQLDETGFERIEVENVTKNVLPSMMLAAASCRAHRDEKDSPPEVQAHRQATIACEQIMRKRIGNYLFITAQKPLC